MFGEIIGAISNFMYSYLLIIMLIGVGLYYTLRTRLVQVRMFKETIRVILEKPVESGAVSSFQALMVSTASRVGTGNIIGISTAICLGGYGAVFWMWVCFHEICSLSCTSVCFVSARDRERLYACPPREDTEKVEV